MSRCGAGLHGLCLEGVREEGGMDGWIRDRYLERNRTIKEKKGKGKGREELKLTFDTYRFIILGT